MPSDEQIESALIDVVTKRGVAASACPSEVARKLSQQSWREWMPDVRRVAAKLAESGRLEITQRGLKISPAEPFKGPIRIRLGEKTGEK